MLICGFLGILVHPTQWPGNIGAPYSIAWEYWCTLLNLSGIGVPRCEEPTDHAIGIGSSRYGTVDVGVRWCLRRYLCGCVHTRVCQLFCDVIRAQRPRPSQRVSSK